MCMATLIPAHVRIPYTGLDNGAATNNDGHGFAIASSTLGLETFGSMKFEETIDRLYDARKRHGDNSVILFHSRWATHGEYGEFNIHPFAIGDGGHTVMAHNGILPSVYLPVKGDRRSDTRIFAERMAEVGVCDTARGVPSRRTGGELGRHIGGGNKLVFLSVKSGQPAVRIINSHLGVHVGGVWYSNSGYCDTWRPSWRGTSGGYSSTLGYSRRDNDPEVCPMCQSAYGLDLAGGWCWDCELCLDCEEFIADCQCYTPSSARRDDGRTSIEALADDNTREWEDAGYMLINGVWKHWTTVTDEEAVEHDRLESERRAQRIVRENHGRVLTSCSCEVCKSAAPAVTNIEVSVPKSKALVQVAPLFSEG